jgi:hypothetical protein
LCSLPYLPWMDLQHIRASPRVSKTYSQILIFWQDWKENTLYIYSQTFHTWENRGNMCVYQCDNLEVKGIKVRVGFPMQRYKREKSIKVGRWFRKKNLDSWRKIVLYLLWVRFWNGWRKLTNMLPTFFSHLRNSLIYQVIFYKLLEMLLGLTSFPLLVFDFFSILFLV